MPPRKKAAPSTPEPIPNGDMTAPPAWSADDLKGVLDSLARAEEALAGFALVNAIDVVLNVDGRILAAHNDGARWWVSFP